MEFFLSGRCWWILFFGWKNNSTIFSGWNCNEERKVENLFVHFEAERKGYNCYFVDDLRCWQPILRKWYSHRDRKILLASLTSATTFKAPIDSMEKIKWSFSVSSSTFDFKCGSRWTFRLPLSRRGFSTRATSTPAGKNRIIKKSGHMVQSINQSIHPFINQSIHQSISRSTNNQSKSINQSNQSINRTISRSNDRTSFHSRDCWTRNYR